MPINTKYPLADVIDAAKVFDRRVTFEYVMLGGVNDASRARDPTGGAGARMPRVRQSDSPAPGRRARLHPDERRRHSPLRARAARRGRRGGGAKEPRRGHRRRVRSATGGTARPAAATTTRSRRRYPGSVSCRCASAMRAGRKATTQRASPTRGAPRDRGRASCRAWCACRASLDDVEPAIAQQNRRAARESANASWR